MTNYYLKKRYPDYNAKFRDIAMRNILTDLVTIRLNPRFRNEKLHEHKYRRVWPDLVAFVVITILLWIFIGLFQAYRNKKDVLACTPFDIKACNSADISASNSFILSSFLPTYLSTYHPKHQRCLDLASFLIVRISRLSNLPLSGKS